MSSTGPSPTALTPDRSPSKAKLLVQRSDSRQHLAVHFAAAAIREDCSDDDDENLVLTNVSWHEPAGNTLGAPNAKVLSTLADSSLPAVSGEPPVLVTELPLTAIDGAGSQCSRSLPLVSRVSIRHYQESKPTSFKGTEGECGKLFTKVCSAASVAATSITATKPLSFVRSLATETPELKETALKPKNLINIVKSLSSDSGSLDQEVKAFAGNGHGGSSSTNTVCGPDFGTAKLSTNQQTNSNTKIGSESLLNMQLWRQFAQPRLSGAVLAKGAPGSNSGGKNSIASDSKTAPTSPLSSPSDGRSSFFRVSEVEARIEDTKRRLSEVIQDPRQLLNKIMGEDMTGRSRAIEVGLPATTTDLVSLNGSTGESASCRVTLGDGCDPKSGVDPNTLDIEADVCATLVGVNSPPFPQPRHTTAVSDNVSLSDLVSRNEDEFEHLFMEDFDNLPDDLSRTSPEPAVLSEDTSEKEDDQRTRREDGNETEEDDDFEEHASASPVPIKAILLIVFAVYTYLVLPLPEYINGLCVGLVLGFILAVFSMWWTSGFAVQDSARQRVRLGPPFKAKALEIGEPKIYRGWMNDVSSYDPETHHMALSRSVFVRLEGTMLRLSRPQCNIPRRAVYGERRKENFVSQNHYELAGCQVFLVPSGLANKRIWNQKYPICLILASQSMECRVKDQREIEKEELIKDLEEDEEEEEEEGDDEEGEEDEIRQDSEVVEHRAKRDLAGDIILYLFGRTGREKEEWFRRFLRVSSMSNEKSTRGSAFSPGRNDSACRRPAHSHDGSQINVEESSVSPLGPPCDPIVRSQRDYVFFLSKFFPNAVHHNGTLVRHADSSPTRVSKDAGHSGTKDMQYAWLNALLSRIFWDFLNERDWIDWVSFKIQKKLGKIKLPYFMNELRLTELDMGTSLPHIIHANKLAMDNQGLWIDLEVSYKGSFQMTLETKMNLTRLGKESDSTKEEGFRLKCSSLADSDEESSSAGSSDEEEDRPLPPVDVVTGPICDKPVALGTEGFGGGGRTSRKILRFMDKIAKSRYFQRATENEYIKKKMEEVSNTPLLLTVAVQECRGELAINIPSPPTDRIWYGFRRPPHLELKARPKLGERQVTFTHVQEWIESKLEQEFQKILVMPNMDDLYLPIMHPAPETNYNLQKNPQKPSSELATDK
uniref:Testis expressed 2 n=1 Tax=Eptatretus burgeri TaxID=7764 RepID=A0A8C4NI64_EPTBU